MSRFMSFESVFEGSFRFADVTASLSWHVSWYTTPHLSRCHGLSVYPVCVCNTVRLGQVRSRHNLKPSGTRFECVSGLSVW